MQVVIPCIGYGACGLGMSPHIGLTHQQHHQYVLYLVQNGLLLTHTSVSRGSRT